MKTVTVAERPELVEPAWEQVRETLPEYNNHGDVCNVYWPRLNDERLGAEILKPEPQSLRITGTVAEWEEWTGWAFPETGEYWFPRGLATVAIDRPADRGSYWEPNVWMRHAF